MILYLSHIIRCFCFCQTCYISVSTKNITGLNLDHNKLAGLWMTGGAEGLMRDAIIKVGDIKEYLIIIYDNVIFPLKCRASSQ